MISAEDVNETVTFFFESFPNFVAILITKLFYQLQTK